MADMAERKRWADYQDAYEDCLRATSSDIAPWYMVPADDKENARLIMSQVLIEQLGNLKMSYPQVTEKRLKELKTIRKLLAT
jgi:polyphosphate kinase 2 (PPK2 family)